MSKGENRQKQTIRFLSWAKKYRGWMQLICNQNNGHMNIEIMQMLIKRLAKEEFYEIIFVLLEVHKGEEFVKDLRETMLNDLLVSQWKKGNSRKIINKFIMHLQ